MTPIERAARAMYDNVKPDWEWEDPDAELLRAMYRENARAAIAAIREPSDAAIDAGEAELQPSLSDHYDEPISGRLSAGVWEAMIDAILPENEK